MKNCDACNGKGWFSTDAIGSVVACGKCNGLGLMGNFYYENMCERCGGAGGFQDGKGCLETCEKCNGTGGK